MEVANLISPFSYSSWSDWTFQPATFSSYIPPSKEEAYTADILLSLASIAIEKNNLEASLDEEDPQSAEDDHESPDELYEEPSKAQYRFDPLKYREVAKRHYGDISLSSYPRMKSLKKFQVLKGKPRTCKFKRNLNACSEHKRKHQRCPPECFMRRKEMQQPSLLELDEELQ